MKQFFKFLFASTLGVFLALILFVLVIIGVAASAASMGEKEVKVEENSVLHLKIGNGLTDKPSSNPFENFDFGSFKNNSPMTTHEILKAIETAKTDDKIKGILIEMADMSTGIAMAEEVRNKLESFKAESGKFILSYSEMYSQRGYYMASVADRVYLNPQGLIEFKGLSSQVMFFKGALEKLEVEAQIIRHGKFKSAVEPFFLDKMSDANKEQVKTYLGSIWDSYLTDISKSRNISKERLHEIADGFLARTAQATVDLGMVDKLIYKDDLLAELVELTGAKDVEDLKMISDSKYVSAVSNSKYANAKSLKDVKKDKIAIIYAEGNIMGGNSSTGTIGSETLTEEIRKARMDEKVKAIVLRVNSPGGSALASDVIWREIVLAKKEKPVIVSMGNLAASGGYYISCAADTIVADENTITGSIGVFGVLYNFKNMINNKLGITIDTVKIGKYSDLLSPFRPMTEGERAFMQSFVEETYDTFITRVSEGRGITKAQVDSIGQGRVWTGKDALKLGLVDVIGGLETAIEIAAKKANLENYEAKAYPEPKTPIEEFMKELTGEVQTKIFKTQVGPAYEYYKAAQTAFDMEGIQARIPYDMTIR
jgi:protease IV